MKRFVHVGAVAPSESASSGPGMAAWELTVLGVIAIGALVGGIALGGLGALTFLAAGGSGNVLGMIAALSIGLGELVLAAFTIVAGALLLRAVRALGKPGAVSSPGGLSAGVFTRAVAAAVLVCWILPAALTSRDESTAGIDAALATVAIGVGLVEAAAAFAARDLLRRPLGVLMIAVSLVSVVLPLWFSSTVAAYQGRQDAYAAERAHFEERYAAILGGPTIEEVAAHVGEVGGWRLLGGSISPMERGQRVVDQQGSVADLGGKAVQFALVAQCTADYDGGQLTGFVSIFGNRRANGDPVDGQEIEFDVVPCDGQLYLRRSDTFVLPEWDTFTLARPGGWELVMAGGVVTDATPVAGEHLARFYADSGARWLVFVTPQPSAPVDPLLVAVGARLAPLPAR